MAIRLNELIEDGKAVEGEWELDPSLTDSQRLLSDVLQRKK